MTGTDTIHGLRCAVCQDEYGWRSGWNTTTGEQVKYWSVPKIRRRKVKGDPQPCRHDGDVEALVILAGGGMDWVAHEVTR